MNGSWSSITVRSMARGAVLRALRDLSRTAHVSPAERGWVVVYDRDSELQSELDTVSFVRDLTALLGTPALAVAADVRTGLRAWFFECGRLVDRCRWAVEGLQDDGAHGPSDPAGACCALGLPDAVDDFERLLDTSCDRSDPLFLHDALVNALGLPQSAVGIGYRDIEAGDAGGLYVRVPAPRRGGARAGGDGAVLDEVAARVAQAPLALGAFLATSEQELAAATHASDEARRHRLINHLRSRQLPVLRAVLRHCPTDEERERVERFLVRAEQEVRARA